MIKLEYSRGVRLKHYTEQLKKVGLNVKKALKKGYVGNKKLRLDTESRLFLQFLNNNNQQELRSLLQCRAADLEDLIEKYETLFSTFSNDKGLDKDKRSKSYHVIYNIFVSNGYNSLKQKSRFYLALGVSACPYCNMYAIKPFTRNRTTYVTGELDHFFCKDKYPYLALTKENLIPSCSTCNGVDGKHEGDFYQSGLINPFCLNHNHEFTFGIDLKPKPTTVDYKNIADFVQVQFKFVGDVLKKNHQVFKWKQRYGQEEYRKLATDVITEASLYSNEPYKAQIKTLYDGTAITMTEADVFRQHNHVTPYEEDFLKTPNSKFIVDIFKDVVEKSGGMWRF